MSNFEESRQWGIEEESVHIVIKSWLDLQSVKFLVKERVVSFGGGEI
jgi:hypothetical protein